MHINNTTKGKHITKSERQLIGMWKNQEKLSNRTIAKRLGKAPQTIHNEIKRGWIDLAYSGGEGSTLGRLLKMIMIKNVKLLVQQTLGHLKKKNKSEK